MSKRKSQLAYLKMKRMEKRAFNHEDDNLDDADSLAEDVDDRRKDC